MSLPMHQFFRELAALATRYAERDDAPTPPLPQVAADTLWPPDRRLLVLERWRKEEARRRSVAPFFVLTNRTLAALAAARPNTLDDLGRIPGIGPRKKEEYGAQLLAELARADQEEPERKNRSTSIASDRRLRSVQKRSGEQQ